MTRQMDEYAKDLQFNANDLNDINALIEFGESFSLSDTDDAMNDEDFKICVMGDETIDGLATKQAKKAEKRKNPKGASLRKTIDTKAPGLSIYSRLDRQGGIFGKSLGGKKSLGKRDSHDGRHSLSGQH